jgi:hypothetical protein
MTIVCDEAVETIAVGSRNVPKPRSPLTVPTVEFITERRNGWKQEHLAHLSTGRNIETGKRTLAVGVRRRHNGLVRFEADLFKLDYNLSQDAIARLYRHWHDLNEEYSLPRNVLRRMECHFSKTAIIFDTTAQQADDWKDFLMAVLTDRSSYVALNCPGDAESAIGRVSPWPKGGRKR